jgi:hypothetical protein
VDLGFFFDNSSDFLAVSSSGTGGWIAVNRTLAARLGWSPEEVVARNRVDKGNPALLPCSDGTTLHVAWKTVSADGVDYWIGREVLTDIVRQVHHRIKNHLQTLISLLSLQSFESPDERVRESLAVARTRMQAIARLYEPLYGSADFQWIEFGSYLRSLAAEHMDAGSSIETADVVLEIGQALPLTLIAADTLHNRLRSVELAYLAPGRIEFTAVAADALDLPSPVVVRLLAQQLGADLLVSDDRLSVTFQISSLGSV